MKNSKSFYQNLFLPNEWKWTGYWDNLHHFWYKLKKGGYELKATDADIEGNSHLSMIEDGISR